MPTSGETPAGGGEGPGSPLGIHRYHSGQEGEAHHVTASYMQPQGHQ